MHAQPQTFSQWYMLLQSLKTLLLATGRSCRYGYGKKSTTIKSTWILSFHIYIRLQLKWKQIIFQCAQYHIIFLGHKNSTTSSIYSINCQLLYKCKHDSNPKHKIQWNQCFGFAIHVSYVNQISWNILRIEVDFSFAMTPSFAALKRVKLDTCLYTVLRFGWEAKHIIAN